MAKRRQRESNPLWIAVAALIVLGVVSLSPLANVDYSLGGYFRKPIQKPIPPTITAPTITKISPFNARIGDKIIISGLRFFIGKNSLGFARDGVNPTLFIDDVFSPDGKTITFTLPERFSGPEVLRISPGYYGRVYVLGPQRNFIRGSISRALNVIQ